MHWLIEPNVFPSDYKTRMLAAISAAGHKAHIWEDDWWHYGLPVIDGPVLFHGSLNNAAKLAKIQPDWVHCNVDAFNVSAWLPHCDERWLLNRKEDYVFLPANQVEAEANSLEEQFNLHERPGPNIVFVRPDSPLKPFSGRIVPISGLDLASLDHGFYYDDDTIPVVVSPYQEIGHETRFVIADGKPITGSTYDIRPDGSRTGWMELLEGGAAGFARGVAAALPAPDPLYILDVCQTPDGYRLVEINPFSGADLYHCNLEIVVKAASR